MARGSVIRNGRPALGVADPAVHHLTQNDPESFARLIEQVIGRHLHLCPLHRFERGERERAARRRLVHTRQGGNIARGVLHGHGKPYTGRRTSLS